MWNVPTPYLHPSSDILTEQSNALIEQSSQAIMELLCSIKIITVYLAGPLHGAANATFIMSMAVQHRTL